MQTDDNNIIPPVSGNDDTGGDTFFPDDSQTRVGSKPANIGQQPTTTTDDFPVPPVPPVAPPVSTPSFQKEKEMMQKQDEYQIEEIGKELDLEKEVKEAGVEKIGEEITLPEMVKKNEFIKEDQIVVSVVPPAPQLPLTNNQAKKALHKKVSEAVVWLAVWCLRQIKIYQNKEKA